MKTFWFAGSKIINKNNYIKYTFLVPDIIKKYNGKILAYFDNFKVLEVTDQLHRFVVIKFISFKDEKKFWLSNEYQKASSFRINRSGLVDLILVGSGNATK